MKAAVYYANGGPETFRYEDIAAPRCPREGVLIRVMAISIEDADIAHRRNGSLLRIPHVVGHQCAGVIIEVGPHVSDRSVGQRVVAVMNSGAYAEIAAAQAYDTWPVPDGLDVELASVVPLAWGTANDCLFELGQLQKDETVLVHTGASPLGIAACQLAKRAGAKVLATASNALQIQGLAVLGVDFSLNYLNCDLRQKTDSFTNGLGVNMVVGNAMGGSSAQSLAALGYRGRLMSATTSGQEDERSDPVSLFKDNKTLQDVYFPASLDAERERVAMAVGNILRDVAAGQLQVIIDRSFPLSAVSDAHVYFERKEGFGSVLLKP